MSGFENSYQINKTLRFGATLKEYEKKYESHKLLRGEILSSFKVINSDIPNQKIITEQNLIKICEICLKEIDIFIKQWSQVFYRTDKLAVYKDYYRQLCKKARFDGGKHNSQLIKLSSLTRKYQGIKISQYIVNYWKNNLERQKRLLKEFDKLFRQYKRAIENSDKAHTKPNLINFNKTFSILANLVNEIAIPLSNGSISFPNISDYDVVKDEHIINFVFKDHNTLIESINEMKHIINTNGGYTHFARTTLNQYTAEQKPHIFKKSIEYNIEKLKLIELVEKFKDKSFIEIEDYFAKLDKYKIFNDNDVSVIERTQCFKYKPIPFLVKHQLVEYISKQKKWNEDDVLKVLDIIGKPRSVALEYKEFREGKRDSFNLNDYPIKVALDYAWEQLANFIHDEKITLPMQECKEYLSTIYNHDVFNDPIFRFYADLLYIRKNLGTLEHDDNPPNEPEYFKTEIHNTFNKIVLPFTLNKFKTYKKDILTWIDKSDKEKKKLKESGSEDYNHYTEAKKQLSLIRGQLKERIKAEEKREYCKKTKKEYVKYYNSYTRLTNEFKNISLKYGRKFAELRDKFKEINEITKISHFGIIIEDKNEDRYLLAQGLQHEKQNNEDNLVEKVLENIDNAGEYKTYQVKSLTSKTLIKLIKNHSSSDDAKTPYSDFHTSSIRIYWKDVKQKWDKYKNNHKFIAYVKDCLTNSTMAKKQNWAEFGWDFTNCHSYEEIEHEIDQKAYVLQQGTISKESIKTLVKDGALLLPIINQDITSKARKDKNQFSKDWRRIFEGSKEFRLHPEFMISYRTPVKGYPVHKRYGRLQLVCAFNCEIVPQNGQFISRKQQIEEFADEDKQKKNVTAFNDKVNQELLDKDYKVIGIDRGLKQLATLCVLDKNGKIEGDFDIYRKDFVSTEIKSDSYWKHTFVEKRHILDLSNLRVETTVDGEKVLVDQSLTKVKKNRGAVDEVPTEENKQKIKLKQLSYIRKLQYKMQTEEDVVLYVINDNPDEDTFKERLKNIISSYGEGTKYADLPVETMREMIEELKKVVDNGNNQTEKNKIIELDAADSLKRGIVANMIGVVNFILAKYNYQAYISLEDLSRAYGSSKSGYDGRYLPSTNQDEDVDFKEQQNQMLAGLGTYQFFEMQLLKKLQKIQRGNSIERFVPAFRSTDNYKNIMKIKLHYVTKQFGIVYFIDPRNTSIECPVCKNIKTKGNDTLKVNRNYKENNIYRCEKCGFISLWDVSQYENITLAEDKRFSKLEIGEIRTNNEKILSDKNKNLLNLNYIHNGDDNGAYHIALKTFINLQKLSKKHNKSKNKK